MYADQNIGPYVLAVTCVCGRICRTGEQLQEKVRSWPSRPDSSENHIIARRCHRPGTATWFTQDLLFEEWKAMGSLLWVHGKRT